MSDKTIIKAIRAMFTNKGEFTSSGKNRVSAAFLPHDDDVSQFIVAGHPVFSVSFEGTKASLTVCGFSGVGMTPEEVSIAVKATNFMFGATGAEATAKGKRSSFGVGMSINSEDEIFLTYGDIHQKFELDEFNAILDAAEIASSLDAGKKSPKP